MKKIYGFFSRFLLENFDFGLLDLALLIDCKLINRLNIIYKQLDYIEINRRTNSTMGFFYT